MQVSTSAYYAWQKVSDDPGKIREREQLEAKVCELFKLNKKVYGARRMSDALK